MKRERRETLTQEDEISRTSIIFSNSISTNHSDDSQKADDQDKPLQKVANSMFYKPGDDTDRTDDSEVEDIPRSEVGEVLNVDELEEDWLLFIKMTPYPLTLEEFIVSKASVKSLSSRS
jgi:translation initiation factor 2-alpha kinase 3